MDKNKTDTPSYRPGRYIKYAMGEIVLVVIGILIALSINNWNTERNNLQQAKQHLSTINLNLLDDVAQAEMLLAETDSAMKFSSIFLDQFKTKIPPDNNIQKYLIYLMYERNIEVNDSGIGALLNSNGLSYIEENLQTKILEYYRHIEQLESREINANAEIKTMFEPYVKENYYWIYNKTNPWPSQANFYVDDPRPVDNIDLASVIADKRLEIMVNGRRYQAIRLAQFYSKTILLAKEIISVIENGQS
ncbi:DUF6090 family protein [Fulvivirga sedimenti]|uniref:Uncharacterized protein n=1 Tax=Fulvivirga sedimenti TaxID=2879465 RepID=A0A9X1HRK2_9BACT|nr:DUF6090 family protein [Fulvivirga sedimenti]MCA6074718.1 hypothetical protein [Fulvivirga sedimenti]MCA6075895.1 hypothetical protein [Fulvivirga sedimenti]MCA6077023.1 hypothetical protein [Fulvivirga sedimenti]